jgi:hypothetical protein
VTAALRVAAMAGNVGLVLFVKQSRNGKQDWL